MARTGGEKPYRVYRGGRVKGKVPLPTRERERPDRRDGGRPRDGAPGAPRRRRARNWRRGVAIALALLVVLFVAWAVASYVAFRSGVEKANSRLSPAAKRALAPQEGALLGNPSNILLLGTDYARTEARRGNRHADSMLLLRTDPDRNRLAYLSILRDLRVEIPGHGTNKINAASQFGGTALAIRTVQSVTGIPINHVVVVDFAKFKALIDELGGITVDVPAPIRSNRFDCPYATAERCALWPGWQFQKGEQEMDGRRALVYSRIRENQLNPTENDATRAARQQQVIQAIAGKLTSPRTLGRLPFVGDELMAPVATDLTARQFLQLGWVKFRAGKTLHCRLGGTPFGGFVLADEEKFAVLQMFSGRSAAQPPRPESPLGSGCSEGALDLG